MICIDYVLLDTGRGRGLPALLYKIDSQALRGQHAYIVASFAAICESAEVVVLGWSTAIVNLCKFLERISPPARIHTINLRLSCDPG